MNKYCIYYCHYFNILFTIISNKMYTTIFPQAIMADNSQNSNQIKYPEDIQIIIRSDKSQHGSLFISNLQAAQNKEILQKLNIGAILCVCKGHSVKHPSYLIKYSKYIPLDQGQNIEINDYLEESINFIEQKISLTNVLVHCISGVNKSPGFVIAYLMKSRKLTLQDAFNQVKSRRKIICLGQKIIAQLKKFQSELKQKRGVNQTGKIKDKSIILDKSLRSKSNNIFDKSYKIQDKSLFIDNFQGKEVNQSKMTNRLKVNQSIDDNRSMKSMRSNKSDAKKSQINIQILRPKNNQNPQRSFLSKGQGIQKSVLSKRDNINKSLQSVKSNKSSKKSDVALQQLNDLPQLAMNKKSSSSREQYVRKIINIDNRNAQINKKISFIQDKFEKDSINHKVMLQTQLTQINQLRNYLVKHYNERKAKLSQKSKYDMHDKTMEDKYVEQYIKTMGNQYSFASNY